ncbi:MAG: 30S ribosomal protein S17e [Candidatus Woesearchaeota archaeon]
MGRIKTKLIKTVTNEIFDMHSDKFTTEFNQNKTVVNKYQQGASKKLRNIIAGYATRLKKQSIKNAI